MKSVNKTKKIVAIIQARMGSSRLPGKVLEDIEGKSMLWHIVNRLNAVTLIDLIVVATTLEKKDDVIEEFCKKNGFTANYFCRYRYWCFRNNRFKQIIF